MAGKEFTTKEGAKLFVSYGSLEDGMALVKAVNKVMLDQNLFGKPEPEPTMRLFGDADVYDPDRIRLTDEQHRDQLLFSPVAGNVFRRRAESISRERSFVGEWHI